MTVITAVADSVTCKYCRNDFTPKIVDGVLEDLDDKDQHCCPDCYCYACSHGHEPDAACPAMEDLDGAEYYQADPDHWRDMQIARELESVPCLAD